MQGAAVRTMVFAGSKVAVFPILLSLPLFPAHLHTQLLPAQAALVSTNVQKFEERSPTVLWPVLHQPLEHVLFTKYCSKYSPVPWRTEV